MDPNHMVETQKDQSHKVETQMNQIHMVETQKDQIHMVETQKDQIHMVETQMDHSHMTTAKVIHHMIIIMEIAVMITRIITTIRRMAAEHLVHNLSPKAMQQTTKVLELY
eukprot:TRINITY_DN662_c0_g1_i1.p2 TRINITY_DN662_c0_g1~~TRINITY_DN662_c0_g1_i1.p2  ORF type:complete len:110 (-),score=14.32 TRINITY_DN662_c0_g1_i1:188-517(-)